MAEILIVDDEKDIREILGDIVDDEGHQAIKVGHAQDAIDKVDQHNFDLVILDIWLKESHMDGIDILKYIKNRHPDLPVVIISGHGNIEIAVAAVKQGAFDFIEKPFNIDQLLVVINRALELSQLRRANRQMSGKSQAPTKIIGNSSAMKTFRSQLEKLSKSQTRVMFLGPSGSGKELAARALHAGSSRAKEPFITVNSALLHSDDAERQIFGSEEGGKIFQGLLERANGGSLFFDEITDLPIETQSKILRVINEQSFYRVGSTHSISVDVRFISASKENLEQHIKDGSFREELYHRLAVVPVDVPPLRAHVDDIPLLVEHFVAQLAEKENLSPKSFSEDALQTMQAMPWNGNVRELKNFIERMLILNEDSQEITSELLNHMLDADKDDSIGSEYLLLPLREAREVFEQRYLSAQIARFSGNVSKTAAFIGMERSALHRKMKSLNINGHSDKDD